MPYLVPCNDLLTKKKKCIACDSKASTQSRASFCLLHATEFGRPCKKLDCSTFADCNSEYCYYHDKIYAHLSGYVPLRFRE